MLEALVHVALTDAAADDVTPPLTPGMGWTTERLDWLRAYHRDRRAGLDGPLREGTWAVLVDSVVLGSVRLQEIEDGVLELGIWLGRSARGRGLGADAVRAAVELARTTTAHTVVAETTTDNLAALAVLRALGFETADTGADHSVHASLRLDQGRGRIPDRQPHA